MTEREHQARLRGDFGTPEVTLDKTIDCLHRSVLPAGKLRCNCSNQPACYRCFQPFVTSGYCIPVLPQQPGDGAIVLPDGTSVSPKDSRFRSFIPWPLKDGEIPHGAAMVVCSTCPHRHEPPPQIAVLRSLGIDGDYDPVTGACDVVHYLPAAGRRPPLVEVPKGIRSCTAIASRNFDLAAVLSATQCKLVVFYWNQGNFTQVKTASKQFPSVKFWFIAQPPPVKKERIENVHFDLPDDMEAGLEQRRQTAYAETIRQILS